MNPNRAITGLGLGLVGLSLFAFSPTCFAGLSPKEIMVKSEQARKIPQVTASCKLIQDEQAGKTKVFKWWRKIADNQVDYRTMVRFSSPATVRGEGILILENDQSDNQVLLYLPAYKKIRRVENQQQTGRFMGSEFSYSDIATPHVEDYSYSGGHLGSCPADSKARGKCYVVEAKPANDRVSERTGYSRIVNWVSSSNFTVVKAEFYDSQGALYKRLYSWDIRPVSSLKGKWMAHQTEIHSLKTGRSSRIEFSGIKTDTPIPESTFTQQNLSAE